MKKLSVLYVGSTLRRAGPVRQLYNLVKYLDGERFAPSILTLSPEPPDSLLEQFGALGVPCRCLGLSRLAGAFRAVSRIKRFLTEHPADLVHVWGLRAAVFLAGTSTGPVRIATKHEGFRRQLLMSHGPLLGALMNSIYTRALEKFDTVVCVSEYVRHSAPAKLSDRLAAIRNGADTDEFAPVSARERSGLKHRLGLPREGRIFLCVGHLDRRKDPVTVIRGFLASGAAKKGSLVVLGGGPLRARCKRLCPTDARVRFAGYVNNVVEYLQAADVFVSASLAEGLPNSLVEALACGLPAVVSDIPPHREVLGLAPQAGLMFTHGDISDLARRLGEVAEADLAGRGEAALRIVREHLNARDMSQQYQSLYLQCTEGTA